MEVVPGTRLRCVKRSAVRKSVDLSSEFVGFLEAGSEITALDVQASDVQDAARVRYLQGWVSTRSAMGAVLLEPAPQSSPPPVPSLNLDVSENGLVGDAAKGSTDMDALDDLMATMRQMEVALHGASRSGHSAGDGDSRASTTRRVDRTESIERASRLLSAAHFGDAAEAFKVLLARNPSDESAQRGLHQAQKGLRLELEEWFSGLGLQQFARPILELGYESLRQLQDLSDLQLQAAHAAVGMTSSQAQTTFMALRGVETAGHEEDCGEGLLAAPGVKASLPSADAPEDLPRGLLSQAQSTSGNSIASWVQAWRLADSVEQQLQELGVETVSDLQALDADDIADLRRPLKKVQSKKFVQALAQALDDIETEMVEQELNRAHEVCTWYATFSCSSSAMC